MKRTTWGPLPAFVGNADSAAYWYHRARNELVTARRMSELSLTSALVEFYPDGEERRLLLCEATFRWLVLAVDSRNRARVLRARAEETSHARA